MLFFWFWKIKLYFPHKLGWEHTWGDSIWAYNNIIRFNLIINSVTLDQSNELLIDSIDIKKILNNFKSCS